MKFHQVGQLKAYYTKKGRIWHVEEVDQHHHFKSVEEMVEQFPSLLEVEAIKNTVERRAIAKSPVEIKKDTGLDTSIRSTTVECYYCSGTGEIFSGMPCPNCKGKGVVTVTTKGL